MFKPDLNQLEDFLELIDLECPKDVYGELAKFQPDCDDCTNCYECWYTAVRKYQIEESLKSMNDEEDFN